MKLMIDPEIMNPLANWLLSEPKTDNYGKSAKASADYFYGLPKFRKVSELGWSWTTSAIIWR